MEKIIIKVLKWFNYEIILLNKNTNELIIDCNHDLQKYIDIDGYNEKLEPLKRDNVKQKKGKMKSITKENLEKIGFSIKKSEITKYD